MRRLRSLTPMLCLAGLALGAPLSEAQTQAQNQAQPQPDPNFEAPPSLAAATVVPPRLLTGPFYRLKEPIALDGYLGRFEIESDFGLFSVTGVEMLGVRTNELLAIDALNKVDKSAAFGDALARSAQAPLTFAGDLITDPNKTVENVATGVGTMFNRVGRFAKSGVDRVGDANTDTSAVQTGALPGASTQTVEPEPPSFTGDPFGYNKARREWAKKLNVDPYTSNPVLRAKLDEVATASFSGGFAIDTAIGFVAAPLQYAISFEVDVRDSVWNVPVVDLEERNEKKLDAMGIRGRVVRDLFRNRWMTPTLTTLMVATLEQFPDVSGREGVVAAAAGTQGETRVRFMLASLRMLVRYHQTVAHLSDLAMSGLVPTGHTASGDLVVAANADYLWWNAPLADAMQRPELAAAKRTLLVAGKVTPRAAVELANRGWVVSAGLRETR